MLLICHRCIIVCFPQILEVQSITPLCGEDHVIVNDVSEIGDLKQLARLCNVKQPDGPLFSSWNRMRVTMYADQAHSGEGFMAEYKSNTFQLSPELEQEILFDCGYIE